MPHLCQIFGCFVTFFENGFFANISRTVRARAKILVEINPLRHIHTPPHLFPAKNVILSKSGHELPKFGHFLMKKKSRDIGFWPFHLKPFPNFLHFCVILVDFQPISYQVGLFKNILKYPTTPCLLALIHLLRTYAIISNGF